MPDSPFDKSEIDSLEENEAISADTSYPRSIVAGVLVLCGLIVLLVFWQMKYNLLLEIPLFGEGELAFEQVEQNILELEDEQLKLQDSDEDGLTDYEELRIYGSSPFIADTDSDGLSDFEEITSGSDPNCPQGLDCFGPRVEQESIEDVLESPEFQEILADPEQIRALLIETGADPELVNSLDEQTLQIMAQEALLSASQPVGDPTPEPTDEPTQEELAALSTMSPEAIRIMLFEIGAFSQEELNEVSDEELKGAIQEILRNYQ